MFQKVFLFYLRVDNIRKTVSEESTQYMRNYRYIKSSLKKLEEYSKSVGEKISQIQRKDQLSQRHDSCLKIDEFQENNQAQLTNPNIYFLRSKFHLNKVRVLLRDFHPRKYQKIEQDISTASHILQWAKKNQVIL